MENPSRRLESLKAVQQRVPFSRSTIYAKIKSGDFPAPVRISENRVAWDSAVIDEYIDALLREAA